MYFFKPEVSPHLIDGMIDAQQMLIFKQNSSSTNAVIHRSENATDGIEFTWSIWLNIHKLDNVAVYQHIFHKGNSNLAENGLPVKPTTKKCKGEIEMSYFGGFRNVLSGHFF